MELQYNGNLDEDKLDEQNPPIPSSFPTSSIEKTVTVEKTPPYAARSGQALHDVAANLLANIVVFI
jgi:hypothetical protein